MMKTEFLWTTVSVPCAVVQLLVTRYRTVRVQWVRVLQSSVKGSAQQEEVLCLFAALQFAGRIAVAHAVIHRLFCIR